MKLILILLFCFSIFVQAQDYQLTLSSGNTLFKISFENTVEDLVVISHSGQSQLVTIDSIIKIRKIKESKFGQLAGMGLIGGAVIGAYVGYSICKGTSFYGGGSGEPFGTTVGAGIGGFTGFICCGLIGAAVGLDKVYDLSEKSHMEKLVIIDSIISQESKD